MCNFDKTNYYTRFVCIYYAKKCQNSKYSKLILWIKLLGCKTTLTPTSAEKEPSNLTIGERLRARLNKATKKPKSNLKIKYFMRIFHFFSILVVEQPSMAGMLRSLALATRQLPNNVKKLKSKIYVLNKKILRLQQAAQRRHSKKPSDSEGKRISLGYLVEVLKPAQYELVAGLIENAGKKPEGRRYTYKFKTICLGLYIFDPRAYNNLRKLLVCFPTESTLKVVVNIHPILHFKTILFSGNDGKK